MGWWGLGWEPAPGLCDGLTPGTEAEASRGAESELQIPTPLAFTLTSPSVLPSQADTTTPTPQQPRGSAAPIQAAQQLLWPQERKPPCLSDQAATLGKDAHAQAGMHTHKAVQGTKF